MLSFSGTWLNASSNEKILIRINNSQMATEVFFTLLILPQSLPITPKQVKGKVRMAGRGGGWKKNPMFYFFTSERLM